MDEQDQSPEPQNARVRFITRHDIITVIGFVLMICLVPALMYYDAETTSQRVELTVLKNNAAKYCELRIGRFAKHTRAFDVPGGIATRDCGRIETDIGTFVLPVSGNMRHWRDSPRSEIHGALREGCRVEVTVVGTGDPNGDSRPGRKSWMKRIAHVHRQIACEIAEGVSP